MPLSFLVDENLRGPMWYAIEDHNAKGDEPIDAVCVGELDDVPLGTLDPEILLWTERESRIFVSFDKSTLPGHLDYHLRAGHHSPGIFLVRRSAKISAVVEFLGLAAHYSAAFEWQDRIEYIP